MSPTGLYSDPHSGPGEESGKDLSRIRLCKSFFSRRGRMGSRNLREHYLEQVAPKHYLELSWLSCVDQVVS